MSEQKVLIDCRDAALGYEGRPIWEHLTFQVRRGGLSVHRGGQRLRQVHPA